MMLRSFAAVCPRVAAFAAIAVFAAGGVFSTAPVVAAAPERPTETGPPSGTIHGERAPGPVARALRFSESDPELLATSRQHTVVVVETPESTTGVLYRYRVTDGTWGAAGEGVPVVVGRNGVGPKREGDGRAPQGVFPLGFAFGYAQEPPVRTELTYRHLPPSSVCVDDSASDLYNRVVFEPEDSRDWTSAEQMRRDLAYGDDLYSLGVTVGYNADAVPGDGSCIFLHVWRSSDSPTAGCTAMADSDLRALLGWLQPQDDPVLVQGTRAYLEELRSRGLLPYPVPG